MLKILCFASSGNYDKWRLAGEDLNYLPHWIKEAGYRAECEIHVSET